MGHVALPVNSAIGAEVEHRPDSDADQLGRTAWALMANTVTTSVLGVVFWVGATHVYSASQVGEDAALISAMVLLSSISQLNLNVGIARLLPQVARQPRAVVSAYAVTAAAAVVLTASFLFVVPRVSGGFTFLTGDRWLQAALIGAVVMWNIFSLQDAVLASARWAIAVPVENGIFGLLKVGLMFWLAHSFNGHGIFAAWALAMAILVWPVNALVFGRVLRSSQRLGGPPRATALPLGDRARVTRFLVADYAAALLSQGSTAVLPILVIGVLGRSANAYFYVAFLIAGASAAMAQSLSTALIVEAAHDESKLAQLARRSVRRYVLFVVPGVAALALGAPFVLHPFGGSYVAHGETLLRLLLVGTVPQAVVSLYLSVERVRGRANRVLLVEVVSVVTVVGGSFAGMRWFGLAGVGGAWLVAQSAVAVVVLPELARALRPERAPRGIRVKLTVAQLLDVAAVAVTGSLLVMSGLGVSGPMRTILALVFVTLVPGWAVLDHVKFTGRPSKAALAVAFSLTACSSCALAMLWLSQWRPALLLDLLGAASLAAILSHLGRHAQEQAT